MCIVLLILTLAATAGASEFRSGADVSFLPQVEAAGGEYTVQGKPVDLFVLLRAKGVDTVRLRLWHTPPDGANDLTSTLALAARAHAVGLDLLLDIHYSDSWADPGQQAKPAAWTALSFEALTDSVQAYTRGALTALVAQGTPPSQVQLGNEISRGMLWNDGRVGGGWDTPEQWDSLAALLAAGADAVAEIFPDDPPEILIHYDNGGNADGAVWFFEHLTARGVPFDGIALSYYPWWHGSLDDLSATLRELAASFGKPVTVVETAYPWTLGWADGTHNPVGLPEHLLAGYPATPQGQRRFLAAVLDRVARGPAGLGGGVFWWAPEWIATPAFGSSWENCALFDFAGESLTAWGAWRSLHAPSRRGAIRPQR